MAGDVAGTACRRDHQPQEHLQNILIASAFAFGQSERSTRTRKNKVFAKCPRSKWPKS
jgi:hypothetical protein